MILQYYQILIIVLSEVWFDLSNYIFIWWFLEKKFNPRALPG